MKLPNISQWVFKNKPWLPEDQGMPGKVSQDWLKGKGYPPSIQSFPVMTELFIGYLYSYCLFLPRVKFQLQLMKGIQIRAEGLLRYDVISQSGRGYRPKDDYWCQGGEGGPLKDDRRLKGSSIMSNSRQEITRTKVPCNVFTYFDHIKHNFHVQYR